MKKYFGDKAFYKRVILIALPIMLQQGISSFVNLLDNMMIGNYNVTAMTGVGIVNQLFFVINILTIGGLAAAGIYFTQYYGSGNQEGMRNSFRFKLWMGAVLVLLTTVILLCFGKYLIQTFLTNPVSIVEKLQIEEYAHTYMLWILLTILPFVLSQVYSSSLREVGETIKPMIAGAIAVGVNAVLNLWFIFGGLGIPSMGVVGAALATLIARLTEMIILIIFTHRHKKKYTFIIDAYRSVLVPKALIRKILGRGFPLIINEFLWALGMTVLVNIYSRRGTSVLTAFNISSTTTNLFYVVFGAMATSISIMVGQALGAGKLEEAYDNDRKLIVFSVLVCIGFGSILALIAPFVPYIYKDATEDVRNLATSLMLVIAVCMPIFSFNSACFYTLRAGGVTIVTFLFDSLFVWAISITSAFALVNYTNLNIILIYFIVQVSEIIKTGIGYRLITSKIWVKNLTTQME